MIWEAAWAIFKKVWPFIVVGLLLAAVAYWYHGQISDAREAGAKTVQDAWDADKQRRVQLASNLAILYAHQLDVNEQNALKAQEEMRNAKALFDERIKDLPPGPTIFISAATGSVLDDVTKFANGGPNPATPSAVASGTTAIPDTTAAGSPAGYISEQQHAAFVESAAIAYRAAVDMFHDVRQRYNDVVAAQQEVMKGAKQ